MVKKIVMWFVGKSAVDRLLLAATVVAGLRMMLIHAVFIDFDLDAWPWFKAAEVISGLAFAVLEGKALAYISRLWVRLRPERWEEWLYWSVLAMGQFLLLVSIIGVTAFAASSVRQGVGIDALLGNNKAVAWSMFVVALNPLMVILIGISRAIDPAEQDEAASSAVETRTVWPPLETQLDLFLAEYNGPALDPPGLVARFEQVSGHRITLSEAEAALLAGGDDERLPTDERRARVKQLMGEESMAEMSRRFGVSYSTIKRDVELIQAKNGTG